jgi:hypothetical protein
MDAARFLDVALCVVSQEDTEYHGFDDDANEARMLNLGALK